MEHARIRPQVGGGEFGAALAMERNRLVVGAPRYPRQDPGNGGMTVFRRSGFTWEETGFFAPESANLYDWFGQSVALTGDRIVVGTETENAASVYELAPDGVWDPKGKLLPQPGTGVRFGQQVAMKGDLVAVSDTWDGQGVVQLFRNYRGAWLYLDRLGPPESGRRFGKALWLDDDYLIVTDPADVQPTANSGAIWVYELP